MEHAASEPPFDGPAFLDRIGGDADLAAELAGIMLADLPRLQSAVRLAVGAADPLAIERSAHALKGAVATFEALPVVRLAAGLEDAGRRGALTELEAPYAALEAALAAFATALRAAYPGRPP